MSDQWKQVDMTRKYRLAPGVCAVQAFGGRGAPQRNINDRGMLAGDTGSAVVRVVVWTKSRGAAGED